MPSSAPMVTTPVPPTPVTTTLQGWSSDGNDGTGTTVQVSFPLAAPEESRETPPAMRLSKTTGTETILLVEDEQMLREPIKTLLEDKGYRVITAGDGVRDVESASRGTCL